MDSAWEREVAETEKEHRMGVRKCGSKKGERCHEYWSDNRKGSVALHGRDGSPDGTNKRDWRTTRNEGYQEVEGGRETGGM